MTPFTPPSFKADAFNCALCGAYAHQEWEFAIRRAGNELTLSTETLGTKGLAALAEALESSRDFRELVRTRTLDGTRELRVNLPLAIDDGAKVVAFESMTVEDKVVEQAERVPDPVVSAGDDQMVAIAAAMSHPDVEAWRWRPGDPAD